jgi:hypothetical protein
MKEKKYNSLKISLIMKLEFFCVLKFIFEKILQIKFSINILLWISRDYTRI